MTTYTQYQLSNITNSQYQQIQTIIESIRKTYSFSTQYDNVLRIFTLVTKDANLITLIDSKNVTGIVKTIITISEYDDTKTITDVETAILSNADISLFRPELINKYKSTLVSLQNQAKNLNIQNYQTMTISQLQSSINSSV